MMHVLNINLLMYKPLFLGINNAPIWALPVVCGIVIAFIIGFILMAGIIVYFAVCYIIKIICRMRTTLMKKQARSGGAC
jgi:hypothetical protein